MNIANLKHDLLSGFVVFLISLPLSLGIALASGAPATAGILAAILGGVIGTLITGTHVTITGPAAGLIVVVLHSIHSLGEGDPQVGFKRFLACVVVAGLLQIVFGLLRAGSLAFLCPSSVVHGMIAAIGLIIIIKQLPVLIGVTPDSGSILGLLKDLPSHFMHMNMPIAVIGFFCLFLVIMWNFAPKKWTQLVPAPLLTIPAGIGLASLFGLSPQFLVNLPENIQGMFVFPDFSQVLTQAGLVSVVSIFLVGSLESVLSAYAVDKLDPLKRKSDLNKELFSKGIVNACCGLLGALPVISEIVRSSANIANGAKSKWSNFFHGCFILFFVALVPALLKAIPLAALAAVLIVVGYRLTNPKQFVEIYKHGKDQFVIFMATIILTLAEDILIGILGGIILKIVFHFIKGVRTSDFLSAKFDMTEEPKKVTIRANSPAIFTGHLAFKRLLSLAPQNKELVIDLRKASVVDYTFLEQVKGLQRPYTLYLP